ncbi:MAG: leucine-rich repeat protein [Clostridiales bacterium]|nr:leucine-rich repeat protein [Clostridiales bacterium]
MKRLCTAVTALFVVLFLCSAFTFAVSDVNDGVRLSEIRKIAITNYGPTPEHIWSEFPIDLTTEPPDSSSSGYDTASPTVKPAHATPKPTFIVDAPVTRPPETIVHVWMELDGWQFTINDDGYAIIIGYTDKNVVDLVLPDFIGGYRVIAVGEYAFSDKNGISPYPNLKSVVIPDTVLNIGFGAFYNCGGLEIVTLPAGEIVMGRDLFKGCDKLTVHVFEKSVAHQYAVANHIPFKLIGNKSTASQPDEAIIFYMKPNGTGVSLTRSVGFTAYYYTDMGFDNDNLSSVRINAENVTVKLYDDSEFTGICVILRGTGLYNLSDYDFDNRCSSYAIKE